MNRKVIMAVAVLAIMCITCTAASYIHSDVDAADSVTYYEGSDINGTVGSNMDVDAYVQSNTTASGDFNRFSINEDNLPDDLGLEFQLELIDLHVHVKLVGEPAYAVNQSTEWNGEYTVKYSMINSARDEITRVVSGTIIIDAANTSGSAYNTGSASAPISYIDVGYPSVKHNTDYYLFQYSKIYIPTDYKATVSDSSFGIQYCNTQVFDGGNTGGKVFGYLTKTGNVSITFDTGTDGGTRTITLHVVADKTGTTANPIDDLSRGVATFAGMSSPNSLSGSIGSGKTYYVKVGTYIGIWHHQLQPDNRVDVVSVSPSMPGVSISSGDAMGTATTPGTYKFTMERGSYSATTTIVVVPDAVTATSLSITSGVGGDSITLTANYSPSNADVNLVWNIISGDSYGHISGSGKSIMVYPDSNGRIQIRLTDEISGKTATEDIYVFEMDFDANGGSGAPSSILKIDDSTSYTVNIPSGEPYRSGWRFIGWSETAGGSVDYGPGDSVNLGYSDAVTLFAVYEESSNTFTLAYSANGGSGAPSNQNGTSTSSTYSFTIPATTPSRSGYTFVEWNTRSSGTGTGYDPGDRITVSPGTTTLYAIWDQIEYTCRLNFSASGASNVPSNMSYTGTSTSSHSFTIPSNIPTRSGYTFVEWNTSSSGNGIGYDPGDRISVGYNQTETLYAVWEQITYTCHLNYSASGATNVPSNQSYTGTSTSSHVFTISSQEPVRNGYIFKGWSTSSGGSAQYQPGNTISVGYNSTMTLYAVWESAQLNITTTQSDITLTVGQGFNYTVGTSTSGCTVSVSGASWLHVSGSTVSGTPTSPGEFDVTVTISKAGYTSDSQSFTVTVVSVLGFTSSPVNGLIVIEV